MRKYKLSLEKGEVLKSILDRKAKRIVVILIIYKTINFDAPFDHVLFNDDISFS